MVALKEIQHRPSPLRTQPMRRIAHKHRIVLGAQLLPEFALLGELELRRDRMICVTQHLDPDAAQIMARV